MAVKVEPLSNVLSEGLCCITDEVISRISCYFAKDRYVSCDDWKTMLRRFYKGQAETLSMRCRYKATTN